MEAQISAKFAELERKFEDKLVKTSRKFGVGGGREDKAASPELKAFRSFVRARRHDRNSSTCHRYKWRRRRGYVMPKEIDALIEDLVVNISPVAWSRTYRR